jgi:hypothetical protein
VDTTLGTNSLLTAALGDQLQTVSLRLVQLERRMDVRDEELLEKKNEELAKQQDEIARLQEELRIA